MGGDGLDVEGADVQHPGQAVAELAPAHHQERSPSEEQQEEQEQRRAEVGSDQPKPLPEPSGWTMVPVGLTQPSFAGSSKRNISGEYMTASA